MHNRKKHICQLMDIQPDTYEDIFFESAMFYLDVMLPHDWRGREVLHQDPKFWTWFIRQWAIRDDKILWYWETEVPKLIKQGENVKLSGEVMRKDYPLKAYEAREMHPPPIRYAKYKKSQQTVTIT